ncbi:Phage integrase, N-terminal SAM-like domain [Acetitomaculum ruminis DSM 5522]|uniref:Phage integrase, N-terminal SAM-like domain n=1 Tax=Acetitomaculum ruminis DSM 5522 TaxID=1120918 RepID=A0A1I0WH52_9FIRM|nr:site-specific integrase [Acetitomaculum ruminis]SFA88105.1 Phage integrase, N-terminal SAM-like domain [Acetitomaculum ruminis DSM 5522]
MKIEKRGNGYRIRKMFDGKMYRVTVDYKPTNKEALQLLAEAVTKDRLPDPHFTFNTMAKKYIAIKENVLSPSTIRNYWSILKNISDEFKETRKSEITAVLVQEEINLYAENHSPKSTRNLHGFIAAVIKMYIPGLVLTTTLPQKEKPDIYIPSKYEIDKLMAKAKDTRYEIPLYLAMCGLRRSEIFALTLDDLKDNILTLNKAVVLNSENEKVIKTTKTTSSNRTIVIPEYVACLIKDKGFIVPKNMPIESLNKWLAKTQDQLHIHHFKLHALRHYFASTLSKNGVPEADIMHLGGWATPHVMKAVYRHSMLDKDLEAKQNAINSIFK